MITMRVWLFERCRSLVGNNGVVVRWHGVTSPSDSCLTPNAATFVRISVAEPRARACKHTIAGCAAPIVNATMYKRKYRDTAQVGRAHRHMQHQQLQTQGRLGRRLAAGKTGDLQGADTTCIPSICCRPLMASLLPRCSTLDT